MAKKERIEILNEALAEVLGKDDVKFGDLSAGIWAYIRKNKLHDAETKEIEVDDLLAEALDTNKDFITAKDIFKAVGHLTKTKQIVYY